MKSATVAAILHGVKTSHNYRQIPSNEDETHQGSGQYSADGDIYDPPPNDHLRHNGKSNKGRVLCLTLGAIGLVLFFYFAISNHRQTPSCDTVEDGFTCSSHISKYWGQYSPYFAVRSEIPTAVPEHCQITFAQVLSRHGARDPTLSKTIKYASLVHRIHANATSYTKDYAFIKDYNYDLGADQLSVFGQQQMVNSGYKFYQRYRALTKKITPFIRASGQDRVIQSAQNFTQGFHDAHVEDSDDETKDRYPYNIMIISEDPGSNNTLDHGLCTSFESGYDSTIGASAQKTWADIFTPPIARRLNENLPGVEFDSTDVICLMDLCPFETVANVRGKISRFCSLFTESEWQSYDYYQSVGKYYGYGWGNPLGATQGVGFANELIARMTNSPVRDHTSTNSTLDENEKTFPVGRNTILYADFSHDNDMTAIFASLGLYNSTNPLSNTTIKSIEETKGYSAAWTVPFAARAYFEKMTCVGQEEEYVRVIVNDRILPLETCGGDGLGRCTLSRFIDSLSFAQGGGLWDQCFA